MDSALRDLDQIRETGHDGVSRRTGLLILAALGGVGVVFAMGMAAAQGGPAAGVEVDPLAKLDRASGLTPAEVEPQRATEIQREDLTFPEALQDEETRPEVEAAFAAAAAEQQHPDPIDGRPATTQPADVLAAAAAAAAATPPAQQLADAANARAVAALPSTLPASVAAGDEAPALVRGAARDPLVRAALPTTAGETSAPRRETRAQAQVGRDGAYTIQVISYDEPDEAQAFAAALRARGHQAFVVDANITGRGRFWRVRIGPFENMGEAEDYRRRFESTERMNTLVVRRDTTDSIARE